MSVRTIIDSHIHVIDHKALPYGWVAQLPPALQASRSPADFRAATSGLDVTAVMIEFLVDAGHHMAEARYADALAARDPALAAFVASAPVERGAAVAEDLEELTSLSSVRAIRRVLPGGRFAAALEPGFIAGVQTVGAFRLPFEIGVHHASLPQALELVRRCPQVTFVLDHLGTPPIAGSPGAEWRQLMADFGRLPNTRAKLSGLMAGVDPRGWSAPDVSAHLRVAIESFGPSRVMYGSDWPMFTPLIGYGDWLAIADAATGDLAAEERMMIFGENARSTYRLGRAP